MVEGPKVVLKVQRIQSLKGQVLEAMIVDPTQSSSSPLTTSMTKCIGMTVDAVWCLGKELFLTMAMQNCDIDDSSVANQVIGIRLHFGMAGSERLIQSSNLIKGYHVQNLRATSEGMMPKQSRKKWTACLVFNDQALFLYDSTVSTRTSNYLDAAYRSLERDVMSFQKFSIDSVVKQIRQTDQSRQIHEVIMDQSILPGVGNVIKIEGLLEAEMHPHSILSEIDDVWLICLIKKLRDYARYWYDCCKGPGASKPNRKKVYGQHKCGVCGSSITLIRDGVLQRITYFCNKCQLCPAQHYNPARCKQSSFFSPRPIEVKEVQNVMEASKWVCSHCTLDNASSLMECEICGTVRNPIIQEKIIPTHSSTTLTPYASSYFEHCALQGDSNNGVKCANKSSSLSSTSIHIPTSRSSGTINNNKTGMIREQNFPMCGIPMQSIMPNISNMPTDNSVTSFITPLFCTCQKQGELHRVRKSGPTNSRLFWSCSGRKCPFFSWADGTFPKCEHGVPSTVRRVLKPGPTNGQYFFSCSQESKCKFFMWSDKHVPASSKDTLKDVGVGQGNTLKRSYPDITSQPTSMKKFKQVNIPL